MIRLRHIYEDYDLYLTMLSNDRWFKHFEALTACIAMEKLAEYRELQLPVVGEGYQPLTVVETHAGRSEHERYIMEEATIRIGSYTPVDYYVTGEKVVNGDAMRELPEADMILSLFYSINSAIQGSEGYPNRKALVQFANTVYKALKPRGGWFINVLNDRNCMADNLGKEYGTMRFVHPKSGLRERYKIPPNRLCMVEFDLSKSYRRDQSVFVYQYSNIRLLEDGNTVEEFSIEEPIWFRYWGEEEIRDVLREAGFKKVISFYNALPGHPIEIPEHATLDEIDETGLIPSDYLAIK